MFTQVDRLGVKERSINLENFPNTTPVPPGGGGLLRAVTSFERGSCAKSGSQNGRQGWRPTTPQTRIGVSIGVSGGGVMVR